MSKREGYQHDYFRGYVRKDRPITTEKGLRKVIARVAEAHGFEVSEFAEKIINAKLTMCKEDYKLCPCSREPGSTRYCGSPTCIMETKQNGQCHCNLFKKGK